MSSQETDHVSPTEVTPELGKGALDTYAIERAGPETPHLQRGALDLYPNREPWTRLNGHVPKRRNSQALA